jgi:hypothetical protein
MKALLFKLRPAGGIAYVLHLLLLVLLPLTVFVLVRLNFIQLALVMVVLSKWRMFAVRPRFWPALIRANAVDLMVGLSVVLFMAHGSLLVQFIWAVLYGFWLIVIKPANSTFMVAGQAFIGQLVALMAVYLTWADGPLYGLVLVTGLICYLAARHFFDTFDETYARLLSYVWGYFGAALTWLLGHWLLYYQVVAQPTFLLTTIGYGLGVLYYLNHHERLNPGLQKKFIFIMLAIVVIVLTFSDWGNKVV